MQRTMLDSSEVRVALIVAAVAAVITIALTVFGTNSIAVPTSTTSPAPAVEAAP